MKNLVQIATIGQFLSSHASATPFKRAQNDTLQWTTCKTQGNQTVPVTCATLAVPRDYTNSDSKETITLNLVQLKATKQPFKGTVLYNPGGPGIAGRNDLVALHRAIQMTVGGHHDIVTWDPRGTGETLPYSCFPSTPAGVVSRQNFAARGSRASNASDAELGRAWALQGTFAQACGENMVATGDLVGTAFTARDMMQIVDALDEDGMLRFYGQSYGTALGATAAAMFPDRVDKMVLDGVLNPTEYWAGTDVQQLAASDATFDGFLSQCLASPSLCPLALLDRPGMTLHQQVFQAIEQLKYSPLAYGPDAVSGFLDYGLVKSAISNLIYGPSKEWQLLAGLLALVVTRNVTALAEQGGMETQPSSIPPPFPGVANLEDSVRGIRCSDSQLRSAQLSGVVPLIEEFYETSEVMGDYLAVLQPLTCPQWPFAAKERYTGFFDGISTKNPILFVGNTFDPITSLAAAMNASASFLESRVLVHNGYGHTSISQPSLCTAKTIQAYFDDGILPDDGTVCEPSVPLFTNEDPFGINSKRDDGEDEDAAMIDALLDWGRVRGNRRKRLF